MIIPTERWLGGVRMPEPIELMAQDMNHIRQSFAAMQARMESTQSTLEATQSRLREVERARSLTGQSSSNEATGFSVEEMSDPLTNLVEWLNRPKTLNPCLLYTSPSPRD